MASLSALYLTRNEESSIAKSLTSIAPYVDEVVMVDSGSVDKTVFHARQHKNLVVHQHAWVHDFSKSKNFGIRKCSSEWILVVDADEMIDKRSMGVIRSAIDSAPPESLGFAIHIVDYEGEWKDNGDGSNPSSYFPSPQVRVFRKNAKIGFEGKVEESVRPSIERLNGCIDILDARIHHHLWRGKGEEFAKLKIKYYASLGAKELKEPHKDMNKDMALPAIEQPTAELAIIMVGYNCLSRTKAAIESIQRTTEIPYKFYFVNNGSNDATLSYIRTIPNMWLIDNPTNQGISKARNSAARAALSDHNIKYVCFLDNDIITTQGWATNLMKFMENHPTCGVVGPMTSFCDGPQLLLDRQGDAESVAKSIEWREPDNMLVERICGFCMFVRTELLRKIGLFEESFGTYGNEDHDFCLRTRQANMEVAVCSRVYVEHVGRATLHEMQNQSWHNIMRTSSTRFKMKWKIEPAGNVPAVPSATRNLIPQIASPIAGKRTSIVILTCNRLDVTKECLESVYSNTWNYELIIVDNGSSDGTIEYIRNRFPSATLIKNPKNLGIPKGRNQGIRASSCDHIVLMDNDVVVQPGWLDELAKPLVAGADISGIEAWQLNKDHAACHKCINQMERFDYLGGACCMFKRRVFMEAGLLDEGFSPAYYEDPDICVRARSMGMKLAWVQTPKIRHKEHATLVFGQKDFSYQDALSKSYERFAGKMRGNISFTPEKLTNVPRKVKILYCGMQWDYGDRGRGLSFEHDNFFPSLKQWDRTADMLHFDFVELGKVHGIQRMSEMLYDTVQQFCPDALFGVWFNEQHDPTREMIKKISGTTPAKTIAWFCDSHFRYDTFDRKWADYLDFCTTTSTKALDWYHRDGLGAKVIKTQWACSPKYIRYPDTRKDVDVSFVGQPHGDRKQMVEELRKNGINVETYGHGWGRRLSFDEMIVMFNRTKVNLTLNNACDANYKQIKGRNFEVPGCGGFLMTELAENLAEYYRPNEEIGVYTSTQNLAERIKYYLSHDEERQTIAEAGYRRTASEHTYSRRFDHIFSQAGVI